VTATETRPSGGPLGHSPDSMSAGDMRRRGLVLLAGAVAIVLLVKPIGPLEYYWNPLLVGLAFLAAAAVTGPRSPLWGAGLVVTAWGVAKVIEQTVKVDWAGGMTMIAIGLGGLIAAYLATRGWAVSPASVAWPVVFIGLGQFVHSNSLGSGLITWYTAGLAVVYGAAELTNSARQGDRRSSYAH
jgi:hypothetical protein